VGNSYAFAAFVCASLCLLARRVELPCWQGLTGHSRDAPKHHTRWLSIRLPQHLRTRPSNSWCNAGYARPSAQTWVERAAQRAGVSLISKQHRSLRPIPTSFCRISWRDTSTFSGGCWAENRSIWSAFVCRSLGTADWQTPEDKLASAHSGGTARVPLRRTNP
jgi:hypothetical protein